MENWGLMMFDESLLLLRPSDHLTERKAMITYIVSHEIGHQACGKMFLLLSQEGVWQCPAPEKQSSEGREDVCDQRLVA